MCLHTTTITATTTRPATASATLAVATATSCIHYHHHRAGAVEQQEEGVAAEWGRMDGWRWGCAANDMLVRMMMMVATAMA